MKLNDFDEFLLESAPGDGLKIVVGMDVSMTAKSKYGKVKFSDVRIILNKRVVVSTPEKTFVTVPSLINIEMPELSPANLKKYSGLVKIDAVYRAQGVHFKGHIRGKFKKGDELVYPKAKTCVVNGEINKEFAELAAPRLTATKEFVTFYESVFHDKGKQEFVENMVNQMMGNLDNEKIMYRKQEPKSPQKGKDFLGAFSKWLMDRGGFMQTKLNRMWDAQLLTQYGPKD